MRSAERNEPPQVVVPANRVGREGEPIRFMIDARSSSDLPLTFTSPVLPFGATLNPSTGEFNWTPTYIQDGIYEIPFEVSDGETTVSFKIGRASCRERVCQYV